MAPDALTSCTNVSGMHFVIDTNSVDDASAGGLRLRQLGQAGYVYLSRTDTMDIELKEAEPNKRTALLAASNEYPEHMGPIVLDHSRLDHGVHGSEEDYARIDQVFGLLFPGADRRTARKQHVRDAMHVATAIRYGAHGFVTNEKRHRRRRGEFEATFSGFLLLSPAQAVVIVERMARKALYRAERATGSEG